MSSTHIHIKGAKEHNLKNIEVLIPRDQLVVITGLSGSGKSSLAFDTIYAEGQRRYVESLSSYARQFLDQMEKPEVESIDGLSPAISIEQKTTSRNPRSTVATVTEIYDYLRLLFARIGIPHCPQCDRVIEKQSASQIVEWVLALPEGTPLTILSPVVWDRKGEYRKLFRELHSKGYSRALIDGEMHRLEEPPELDKKLKHTVEVVVDRIKVAPDKRERVADAVENALKLAEGMLKLEFTGTDREPKLMSENLVCLHCQISFPELAPRNFSFNSPHGACPDCDGLGETREFDESLIIPNGRLSLDGGAILPFKDKDGKWYQAQIEKLADHYGFSMKMPYDQLSDTVKNKILYGSDEELTFIYKKQNSQFQFKSKFEGVMNNLRRRYRETSSAQVRDQLQTFMALNPCTACNGKRLQPLPLAVRIQDLNIAEYTSLSVKDALAKFADIELTGNAAIIAEKVLKEVVERLRFL
ncbi:MAG: excinuclease ABC subunit UvrA, partial [Acidobacteria bacterium]|nr:excinuclease ABC subunit UvrA [Acidobacteriota bacterium]